MNLAISHLTRYEYDRELQLLPHLLYLRPRENPLLHGSRFTFRFQPEARVDWMRDSFDNLPASALFSLSTSTLEIRSDCTVSTVDTQAFDFLVRDYATPSPSSMSPCIVSIFRSTSRHRHRPCRRRCGAGSIRHTVYSP